MSEICQFSENGKCSACRILDINCDGKKFINCEEYLVATGKKPSRYDMKDFTKEQINNARRYLSRK